MSESSYYSLDLHETEDGEIKILDVHGNGDVLFITKNAGYSPKKKILYDYVNGLKTLADGKKILYLMEPERGSLSILPKSMTVLIFK